MPKTTGIWFSDLGRGILGHGSGSSGENLIELGESPRVPGRRGSIFVVSRSRGVVGSAGHGGSHGNKQELGESLLWTWKRRGNLVKTITEARRC